MPSLSTYRKLNGSFTNGQIRKKQSDMIMENTWWEDIQSRVAYIYDYYHDDEPDKNEFLNPTESETKTPIDIKYIITAYNSMAKDQVDYHMQFRPSQKCPLDYYENVFHRKYGADFPIGLYVDIEDEAGVYKRWLVVGTANIYNPQFIDWSILPCNHLFQWIYKGKRCQVWGVTRSQNSYNSGLWMDYKFEDVQNQSKAMLPMNDITENLYYNQRMILSAPIPEPITWRISKVETAAPYGINRITLYQDKFDQFKDYIEYDDDGYVIGMWADYYEYNVEPKKDEDVVETKIVFSGYKPQIKVGGSYKKFSLVSVDDTETIPESIGSWRFYIDDVEVFDDIVVTLTHDSSDDVGENQIKVKFVGGDDYLGKILKVTNDSTSSYVEVDIVGL